MQKRLFRAFLVLAFAIAPLLPQLASPVQAEVDFDPGFVMSDAEMLDYDSMSLARIQRFLEQYPGQLHLHADLDIDGLIKPASEIIYAASQENRVNPKYLLVLLQKEQSLIEDPDPSQKQLDWATGYGICDSCSMSDPSVQRFRGFAKQIDGAAWQIRRYMERPDLYGFKPFETYEIDGQPVTMGNAATAGLYNYTPHIHGNRLLAELWDRYFSLSYPDGSVVQAPDQDGVWLLQYGTKRPFMSRTALVTHYDPSRILPIPAEELAKYPEGAPIRFPEYALLRSPDGTIYLLADEAKRRIVSMEVFRSIGFNMEEVITVEQAEADEIPDGPPITMESSYPGGALLQDASTGGVYYALDGIKHPIWSKEIMSESYGSLTITPVDPDQLALLPTGEPARFEDGTLITPQDASTVYVISNGLKRPIFSGEVFEDYGWKWDNVITTTRKAVELHPTGDRIE